MTEFEIKIWTTIYSMEFTKFRENNNNLEECAYWAAKTAELGVKCFRKMDITTDVPILKDHINTIENSRRGAKF